MMTQREPETGEELLRTLTALANPHRLRIVALLAGGDRPHVSALARRVGISRPLLYLHLGKLEAAGLVRSDLGLSDDGKAMRRYEVAPFRLALSPDLIARLSDTLMDAKETKE